MAIFYDEYLNEGARNKYLEMKHKELEELDEELDKKFDQETYDKRKKVAELINKYGGNDSVRYKRDVNQAKHNDKVNKVLNSSDRNRYGYRNPYYWMNKSAEGKEKFMKDFSGPNHKTGYINDKVDSKNTGFTSYNKGIIKDAKSIKEACEYILSVIDESYDYNDEY